MSDARADESMRKMQEFTFAYGFDHLRLLLWVIRQLAHGYPLTPQQVDQGIAELGIASDAAHQFLREVAERDADNQIIGAMGLSLSLSDHPHQMSVGSTLLSAWCALDTLFLPAMLQQTVTVTSPSPVNGELILLKVSPERVVEVSPPNAVLSYMLIDPFQSDLASVHALWGAFCCHIHFFGSHDEAERWIKGRTDIVVLTVEDGFALARQMWSKALPDLYSE
ncbi:MAG TPA: organomercurial lyase [Ktedonobacterales bacterium]